MPLTQTSQRPGGRKSGAQRNRPAPTNHRATVLETSEITGKDALKADYINEVRRQQSVIIDFA
jgi:hypothetical protein